MKDSYEFVAIFQYEDDGGMSILFPDLPGCYSCADTTEEGLKMAEEAMGLYLVTREQENEEIPKPTPIEKIKCAKNEKAFLISVWMPLAREETISASVKKTLTIPAWLNDLAEENKVNFSKVLQAALRDLLITKRKLRDDNKM